MRKLAQLALLLAIVSLPPASAKADIIAISSGEIYNVNEFTGRSVFIGDSGLSGTEGDAQGLALNSKGQLFTTYQSSIYAIDPLTSAATFVVPISAPPGSYVGALTFLPGDMLYADGGYGSEHAIFKIDLSTGNATLVGATGLQYPTRAFTSSGEGKLYGYDFVNEDYLGLSLVAYDSETGRARDINPADNDTIINTEAIYALSRSGSRHVLFGVNDDGYLYKFDTRTGRGTLATETPLPNVIRGIAYIGPGAQPVPEPTTMILLGTGLAGIGAAMRRRR